MTNLPLATNIWIVDHASSGQSKSQRYEQGPDPEQVIVLQCSARLRLGHWLTAQRLRHQVRVLADLSTAIHQVMGPDSGPVFGALIHWLWTRNGCGPCAGQGSILDLRAASTSDRYGNLVLDCVHCALCSGTGLIPEVMVRVRDQWPARAQEIVDRFEPRPGTQPVVHGRSTWFGAPPGLEFLCGVLDLGQPAVSALPGALTCEACAQAVERGIRTGEGS